MAAPVTRLQPVKLAPGPGALTPEQTYWKSFKSAIALPSLSDAPITHISSPGLPLNPLSQHSDHFAVTTGARIQIFSVKTRKLLKTISRFDDTAHGAEIRRDGRVLAAGDETGAIQVFDIGSRAILKTWKEHKQPVWCTKFSPFETISLMSTSDDRTVRLWDLPSQESITSFRGHSDYVRSGAFMLGEATGLLVSGSYDQTVRLWDPRAPARAVMTFKHAMPIESVLSMPSGTTILAAADNQISVLDVVAGRPMHIIRNHQKTVTSLCLASRDTRLVSGALDGHVKVFETTNWTVVAGAKYPSPILALNVVAAGAEREDRHLAVGMQSGILSIKTRLSGQLKAKEKERQKEMQALVEGNIEKYDRKRARKQTSGWQKRLRGKDFTGEGADVIIEGNPRDDRKRLRSWEKSLRQTKYGKALDQALDTHDLNTALTIFTTLRYRSALRAALSDRDEFTLQPTLKWINSHIVNPRHVSLCVEIGTLILEIHGSKMGLSKEIDGLVKTMHSVVRREVDRSQQACQTSGMLTFLLEI